MRPHLKAADHDLLQLTAVVQHLYELVIQRASLFSQASP